MSKSEFINAISENNADLANQTITAEEHYNVQKGLMEQYTGLETFPTWPC